MKREKLLKGLLVLVLGFPGLAVAEEAAESAEQEQAKERLLVICATTIDGVESGQVQHGTIAAGIPVVEAIEINSQEDGVFVATDILEKEVELSTYANDFGLSLISQSEQLETKDTALNTVVMGSGSCSVVKAQIQQVVSI